MSDNRITAYADSLLGIARAEGSTEILQEELTALATAIESDEGLRSSLTSSRISAADRTAAIESALEGKASTVTTAVAGMLVATGHASEIGEITAAMASRSAEAAGASIAEVRSAVALTEAQLTQLAQALTTKMGREIQVRNIVDPTVMGGIVTQIGDEVIDGTVRTRLNQLREAF